MKKNLGKNLFIAVMLCFMVCCGIIMVSLNSNAVALADEHDHHCHLSGESQELAIGLEDYIGYGCNGECHEHNHVDTHVENRAIEGYSGFGCSESYCGSGRENGYSSTYLSTGCRNWQQMPLYTPFYKYWIDESTLNSLSAADRTLFITNVDNAAALWNSTRMHDGTGVIVNLQKMSSNGSDVCSIEYEPTLPSGTKGKFNPIPLFYNIKLKVFNDETPLHEFGHMLGLQDLDMNNTSPLHNVLMGYGPLSTELHYQDIQGLAVANSKHTTHNFNRYVIDGDKYKHVCYYCDLIDTQNSPITGSLPFIDSSICEHTYEQIVSAGDKHWLKCTKCYKVVESDFNLKGINNGGNITIEITGLIDTNKSSVAIPRQFKGQNVTHISNNAFAGMSNLTAITFDASSNITNIGNYAFANCTNLGQGGNNINIPASVTSIGTSIFEGCTSLKSISVDVSNANYASISGILYDKSFTSFVCIPAALSGIIDIPGSVVTIPERAFAEKYWLTEVNISSGSTTIGKEAFLSCSSLSSVTITNNSGSIGERAFSSCYSLSSVQLGNHITSIGNEAFAYGNIFTSITLPNSVTAIGYGAFKQCNNMTTLTLPFVGSDGSINYFGYIFGAPALSGHDSYLPYNLTTVTITDGNIAENALLNCSSITSLNVSSNVNFIGFGAFQGCSGLINITLPFVGNMINNTENTFFGYVFGATSFINNLAYVPANLIYVTILGGIVDDLSFANCQNVTNIWLSNSVLSIGYRAFNNCINLTGVSIGSAVTAIYSQAFFICISLTQISVSSNNQNYSSQAGVLFNKNKTILNTFPNGKGGSYVIPNSVTCIESKAFYNCFELNSVTFPNGLTTIADRAFYGCASIININIPTQVTTIGDEAFYGCTGLQNIALSNGINSIGNRAFVNCNSLSNLIIPNSIVSMGSYLFTNCSNLSIIYNKYPEESLLPNGWSSNWNDINVSVSYYSTTPKNGYWRFLEEIPTVWQVYDNLAFIPINGSTEYSVMNANTLVTDIVLPTTYNNLPVTKIETNGFANSTSLVSIHIPLEITTIGSNAFYGCSNLTIYAETISKPSGWENSWNSTNCPVYWGIKEQNNLLYAISDGFAMVVKYKPANISSMVSIVIPSNILVLGNSYIVNNIESNAFNGFSNISNVTIPNVLTNIGEYAFKNCSNLNEITIRDSVIAIGNYVFYGCSSIIIYAEPLVKPNNWSADWNGSNRQVYWGFIEINCGKYSIENGTAILIKYTGNASTFAMPSTIIKSSASYVVTKIGAGAFSHNSTLATITISNTITTIEAMSFMGCSNLNSINIPSNVTFLGEYVFYYCNSLTSVTLSANINEIPAFSFAGCHNLVSIGIASSVKIIGESAFRYCNALLSINLTSAVTSIRSNAFESCLGLTTFILPNSLISIGSWAFSGCSNISEIIIPSSVTSIGSYAFDSCGTIRIFVKVLYQPVGWSNNWNDSGCPVYWGMTELNGAQYFVRSISVELFRYTGSASSFTIPSSISIQGSTYSVEFIGLEAFINRTTLTSITIPQTITQVGNNAFRNCNLNLQITWYYNTALTAQNFKSYLRYAHFPAGTTTILSGAFANCTKLTALDIPVSVTSIISGAFQGCSNLILFWYYNPSMTAANFSAYLNYVYFPNNTTSISNNAFYGCNKLISIEIPSTVTSIGSYAFYGCSTLTKITIPSSVQNIGSSAFQNCTSLTIITNVTSKPSGWNILWNDSNRPVYWLRTSSSMDIMSGFGYTGSTYYWTGIVNMSQSGTNNSYIRNDGAYVFTNNRIVTFAVRTGTNKNAISIINGSVVFALKNSNGTTIQSHQCSVSVSRTGAVTITSASFDINTSNLINGTYTLTMTSSFTRASWSGTSTSTITIVIDK